MIDLLKGLNIPKGVMTLGGILMLMAAVNEQVLGFTIVEGTNIVVGVMGAVICIVGYIGWLRTKELEIERIKADKEIREERIKAGMEDKTVYGRNDD